MEIQQRPHSDDGESLADTLESVLLCIQESGDINYRNRVPLDPENVDAISGTFLRLIDSSASISSSQEATISYALWLKQWHERTGRHTDSKVMVESNHVAVMCRAIIMDLEPKRKPTI